MTLAITFLAVCMTYLAAFGIGWHLSTRVVLPAYFTNRQGFTQGALVAQPPMRMTRPFAGVAVLEFGAYLLATALGVNVVITVVVGT